MNIEIIPSNWHKYQDVPTPVMVICEKCCKYHSFKEGKEYLSVFNRYSFIGTIGSMNVLTNSNVQKCISCKQEI